MDDGKKTDAELVLAIDHARRKVDWCQFWRHRRSGQCYLVRGVALEAATLTPVVRYGRGLVELTAPFSEFVQKFEAVVPSEVASLD